MVGPQPHTTGHVPSELLFGVDWKLLPIKEEATPNGYALKSLNESLILHGFESHWCHFSLFSYFPHLSSRFRENSKMPSPPPSLPIDPDSCGCTDWRCQYIRFQYHLLLLCVLWPRTRRVGHEHILRIGHLLALTKHSSFIVCTDFIVCFNPSTTQHL